jgi:diguanylate cyclase (GGDEF)-like protein
MGPDTGMFRALVERCPLVSYACAPDGTLTYISPQIEEWTGLPARLWTEDRRHWLRMLRPDDRERVESAAAPLDLEYRMRGRDGWIWVWEREVSSGGEDGTLGICLDITALRHAQEALDAAQQQLGAVVNAAPVILFATDAEGVITLSEGKGLESLGNHPGQSVGTSIFDAYRGMPEVTDAARRALAGEEFDTQFAIGDVVFDTKWRGLPAGGMIGIAIDVTARRRSEERLAHLAYHDPLTGLPNRRNLEEQLGRDLARARRQGDAVAVLYIDLDHFKLVNDSLGHDAGDHALREAATRIGGVVRAGDLVARLGGDEFVLVLAGLGAEAEAATEGAAAKVLAALDAPLTVAGQEFQLGASIGIAIGPAHGDDAGELMRNADIAMYQAKRSGRGASALSTSAARTTATSSRSPPGCAARWSRTSSSCTTSPCTTSRRAGCARWRRLRDGALLPLAPAGAARPRAEGGPLVPARRAGRPAGRRDRAGHRDAGRRPRHARRRRGHRDRRAAGLRGRGGLPVRPGLPPRAADAGGGRDGPARAYIVSGAETPRRPSDPATTRRVATVVASRNDLSASSGALRIGQSR